jgi:hypothetical protein
VVALVALAFAGCVPDFAKNNQSGLLMVISGIRGANNAAGAPMISSVRLPAVNDDAILTVSVFRKNPNVGTTNSIEDVYLDRYEVRFFRTDGHNTQGVDVPYSISGPLGSTRLPVPSGKGSVDTTANFTLVRHQAKLEPPLRNLANGPAGTQAGTSPELSASGVITTIAEVTVYAKTANDKGALTAKGQIQVTFGDFPPTTGGTTPTSVPGVVVLESAQQ